MLSRINILKIIVDHFLTLRTVGQKSKIPSLPDSLLFILFPIGLSVYLVLSGFTLISQIGNLIAAIAILGGFLFNLLAIIYSQIEKLKDDAQGDSLKQRFVNEIHINISFCILLSLFIVISLTIYSGIEKLISKHPIITRIIEGYIYFILILFSLTLLMIINRVYILLKKDSESNLS